MRRTLQYLSLILFISIVAQPLYASQTTSAASYAVAQELCGIVAQVEAIIGILTLLLFIVGGTIYAFSHFLPGQTRGAAQGWSMGMITGGVIGLVIVILSPWVIEQISLAGTGQSYASTINSCIAGAASLPTPNPGAALNSGLGSILNPSLNPSAPGTVGSGTGTGATGQQPGGTGTGTGTSPGALTIQSSPIQCQAGSIACCTAASGGSPACQSSSSSSPCYLISGCTTGTTSAPSSNWCVGSDGSCSQSSTACASGTSSCSSVSQYWCTNTNNGQCLSSNAPCSVAGLNSCGPTAAVTQTGATSQSYSCCLSGNLVKTTSPCQGLSSMGYSSPSSSGQCTPLATTGSSTASSGSSSCGAGYITCCDTSTSVTICLPNTYEQGGSIQCSYLTNANGNGNLQSGACPATTSTGTSISIGSAGICCLYPNSAPYQISIGSLPATTPALVGDTCSNLADYYYDPTGTCSSGYSGSGSAGTGIATGNAGICCLNSNSASYQISIGSLPATMPALADGTCSDPVDYYYNPTGTCSSGYSGSGSAGTGIATGTVYMCYNPSNGACVYATGSCSSTDIPDYSITDYNNGNCASVSSASTGVTPGTGSSASSENPYFCYNPANGACVYAVGACSPSDIPDYNPNDGPGAGNCGEVSGIASGTLSTVTLSCCDYFSGNPISVPGALSGTTCEDNGYVSPPCASSSQEITCCSTSDGTTYSSTSDAGCNPGDYQISAGETCISPATVSGGESSTGTVNCCGDTVGYLGSSISGSCSGYTDPVSGDPAYIC